MTRIQANTSQRVGAVILKEVVHEKTDGFRPLIDQQYSSIMGCLFGLNQPLIQLKIEGNDNSHTTNILIFTL